MNCSAFIPEIVMNGNLKNCHFASRIFHLRLITLRNVGKFHHCSSQKPRIWTRKYFENLIKQPSYQYISSKSPKEIPKNLDSLVDYENVTDKTMESLQDRFEELLEDANLKDWDVNYSNGILTVMLEENCTYVINKQTPNRQIWLSSPISGPKRYDFIDGSWIYKHDGRSLHELLSEELSEKLQKQTDFSSCSYEK